MYKKTTVVDMVQVAIVAALYIVITVALGPLGSGAIQFRLSELFNFLPFYNKKYVWSITIGCMISNYMIFGIVDVIVGGLSTLIFVPLGVHLFKKYMVKDVLSGLLNRAFLYFSIFFSVSMFTIAAELKFLFDVPFWLTWLTSGLGEFISLLIGAIVITQVAKRIDFTK
ncbi:queuosine transporter QueT [Lactococcus hodotermopsidis]|uniref:Queuosine transporter QueT n=1 Tax=Pseudolactococcus hodotermopsidis TaxID=2709157 RepID=A0A6A0BEG2_9LACT|nr:QueT transporter family protein [Lactococcus hodotermopsidis]GFH42884.1 queuosine transporter QueT [Lactococcus hodotermopsidis]